MTDMMCKLKVELGIRETRDWLTQPQVPDNCISLPQQTQRRQGVEWEDNGKGHQSITGCFAIVVITVLCHSHYPCPLAANHTISNFPIWGDRDDYRLEGNHSGIRFFIIHGVIILQHTIAKWLLLSHTTLVWAFVFLLVLLLEQKRVWYKSVWFCNGLLPQGHGFAHWKS